MRPAVPERDAEPLGRTDRDVSAQLTRRREQAKGEEVGGDHRQRAMLVHAIDESAEVADATVARGVLYQGAEDLRLEVEGVRIADDDLPSERLRARAHHLDGLRMAVLRDEERL